jgi:hypothetical protein
MNKTDISAADMLESKHNIKKIYDIPKQSSAFRHPMESSNCKTVPGVTLTSADTA